jgi:hypothetical protein
VWHFSFLGRERKAKMGEEWKEKCSASVKAAYSIGGTHVCQREGGRRGTKMNNNFDRE